MRVVPVACERPCLGRTMQNSDFIEFLKTGSGVTVPMHSITKVVFSTFLEINPIHNEKWFINVLSTFNLRAVSRN